MARPDILKAIIHKKGPGLQAPRVNRAQLSANLKGEKNLVRANPMQIGWRMWRKIISWCCIRTSGSLRSGATTINKKVLPRFRKDLFKTGKYEWTIQHSISCISQVNVKNIYDSLSFDQPCKSKCLWCKSFLQGPPTRVLLDLLWYG